LLGLVFFSLFSLFCFSDGCVFNTNLVHLRCLLLVVHILPCLFTLTVFLLPSQPFSLCDVFVPGFNALYRK
jgi:hypothetical protein